MWIVYVLSGILLIGLLLVLRIIVNKSYMQAQIIEEYEELLDSYGFVFGNLDNYLAHLNSVRLKEHYFGDVEIDALFDHTQFISQSMQEVGKHYQELRGTEDDRVRVAKRSVGKTSHNSQKRKGKKERNSPKGKASPK